MTTRFYAAMSDLEIVGHVSAIPDASELSIALAQRVKLLVEDRERLEQKLRDSERALSNLQLGLAHDRIDGFMEITQGMQ